MSSIVRSKFVRRVGVTAAVTWGFYEWDKRWNAHAMARTFKTLWNGVVVIYELKYNIKPGADFDRIHDRISDRILDVCKGNGGLYIKFGQQIAGMGHVLPPQYNRKFRVLYDDAPTVPYEQIEQLFKEEFSKSPNQLFSYFDPEPIASASIAQVHRATLMDGTKVAVKIQKPDIRKQVEVDLFMYKALAVTLEKLFKMPVSWSADYVIEHMKQELDFVNEAKNSEIAAFQMSHNEELSKQVYIPKVFWDHTTKRVMTAEWIEGVKFSDIETLRKTDYDLPRLMNTIVSVFAYQIFFTGFLHCDPHPGNIIIRPHPNSNTKKPQIVLLDHGLYVTESPKFRKQYCSLWKSLFTMDIPAVDAICREWGINDSAAMAMATLAKPFNKDKAVHLDNVTYRDVYEMQQHHKENLKNFLVDTSKIPLELVFVGRNLNIVRGNNGYLGSPVNRIKIMATYAIRGLDYEVSDSHLGLVPRLKYTAARRWNYMLFQSRLFALGLGFYAWEFWKKVNRFVGRRVSFGDEDFEEEKIQELKKKDMHRYGIALDEKSFIA